MAVIQKDLLGRGMESMAHRKMRMGRTIEMTEAVTISTAGPSARPQSGNRPPAAAQSGFGSSRTARIPLALQKRHIWKTEGTDGGWEQYLFSSNSLAVRGRLLAQASSSWELLGTSPALSGRSTAGICSSLALREL
ncbi:hypothetical protein E2320_001312 [Naja naja]|nr:hypothetical protein E2320_001312 [Naja naja]